MADRKHDDERDTRAADARGRREFLKQAGTAAIAAPALALILKADRAGASGHDLYGQAHRTHGSQSDFQGPPFLHGQGLGQSQAQGHGHKTPSH